MIEIINTAKQPAGGAEIENYVIGENQYRLFSVEMFELTSETSFKYYIDINNKCEGRNIFIISYI